MSSELLEIVVAFVIGLFFGPLSSGFIYFLISIIVLELFAFYTTRKLPEGYKWYMRVVINLAGIIGWILGRWLVINETGVEHLCGLPEFLYKQLW